MHARVPCAAHMTLRYCNVISEVRLSLDHSLDQIERSLMYCEIGFSVSSPSVYWTRPGFAGAVREIALEFGRENY